MRNEASDLGKKPMVNGNAKGKHVDKRSKRKKRGRETNMQIVQPPQVMFSLQRLYMSCLDAFKGPGTVPSPSEERSVCFILDGLLPDDVGIRKNLRFVDTDGTILFTVISQSQNFMLYVLFLLENAVIPLHNHPGMTVFSKLLIGEVHMKAYDFVNDPNVIDHNGPSSSQLKLACLKEEGVLTAPCGAKVLYPTSGGNIHEFTAITACAILDVAGPPFSREEGRDCLYYKYVTHEIPPNENMLKKEDGKDYRWLKEIEVPKESLKMDRIEYLGRKIVELTL
ncbi:plant cysteine oxidase 1-like [Bidens hawaiensis]|uniref:plant cysteine oxidase 1-like n=1 Tax=Bidens hawaiensis TaxID=980011 RepID=UPI00404A05A0